MASFEKQLKELETIVEKLERGDMPLEENVALFERGMELSNACKGALATAESRVRVLLDPKERGPVRVEDLMVAVEADDDLDDEVEIGDDEE